MPKILHFEDDTMITYMYETKFSMEGLEYAHYEHPTKNPVDIVLKEKPDIIIMDIIMPVMNGYQATKMLKEDLRTKDIPILGLCNLGVQKEIQQALDLGMVDYLVAARYTPDQVIERVSAILGLPIPPKKPIPPPGEAWHGPSMQDILQTAPKKPW